MINTQKLAEFAARPSEQILSPEEIAFLLGKPAPSAEQSQVITGALDRPQLVVAAAGAGKTETMAQRVVYLVANGLVQPQEVLGLTFTRKAAAELKERILVRLETLAQNHAGVGQRLAQFQAQSAGLGIDNQPVISTYNAFANRIISDYGARAGFGAGKTLITETRAMQIATQIVHNTFLDFADNSPNSIIEAILGLNGQINEHIWTDLAAVRQGFESEIDHFCRPYRQAGWKIQSTVQKIIDRLNLRLQLLELVKEYRAYKQEHNLIEFSDQVIQALQLVKDNPTIAQEISAPYRVILLDEFQDTSTAQLFLFGELFKGQAVTAVGDPNQSIYGWRGASELSMQGFLNEFEDPERPGVTNSLTATYRNTPRVLEVANQLVNDPKTGPNWEDLFAYYGQSGELLPFVPEAKRLKVPKAVSKNQRNIGNVYCYFALDEQQEAHLIARYLRKKWTEREEIAKAHPDWDASRLPSAAVLIRNHSQTAPIVHALRAAGLPVEVTGQAGLLFDPAVADVRAVLAVTADATRGDHLVRLLIGAGIGPRDLAILWGWARKLAREAAPSSETENMGHIPAFLSDALDHLPSADWCPPGYDRGLSDLARARLSLLSRQLAAIRRVADQSLPAIIGQIIRVFQLDIEVELTDGANQSQRCLETFMEQAAQFEQTQDLATLGEFLTWLDLAETAERGMDAPLNDPDPNAIQVTTIHQSKGLEWTNVVLPGWDRSKMGSGRLPGKDWSAPNSSQTIGVSGWLGDLSSLPFQMRRDREVLPQLDLGVEFAKASEINKTITDYRKALALQEMQEDRRLAYVAVTRAENEVLIGGMQEKDGSARYPSSFLLSLTGGVLGIGGQFETEIALDTDQQAGGNDLEETSVGITRPGTQIGEEQKTKPSEEEQKKIPVSGEKFVPIKQVPPELLSAEIAELKPESQIFHWPLVPPPINPEELSDQSDLTNPDNKETWDGLVAMPSIPSHYLTWPTPVSKRQQALAKIPAELWPRMVECAGKLEDSGKNELVAQDDGTYSELLQLCRLGRNFSAGESSRLLLRQAKKHSPWMELAAQLVAERQSQEEDRNLVYLPQQLAVTTVKQLLGDPTDYARQLRRPVPNPPSVGAKLGTLFHEWADHYFQGKTWLVPKHLQSDEQINLQTWQQNLMELGFAPIGQKVDPQQYWQMLETEPNYQTQLGTTIVARIDAIARAPQTGRITILDWKTDTFHRDSNGQIIAPTPEVHEGYLRQVNQYRLLYAAAHGIDEDQVDSALVYVGGPEIVTLTPQQIDNFPSEFPRSLSQMRALIEKYTGQ